MFDPQNRMFLSFKTKTFRKQFSSYFSFVSALKTIDTHMLFWSVFLKMHFKKVINHQKRSKLCFCQLTTFLCIFKILPKRTYVRLWFLKLNQSQNTEKKLIRGFFFKNQRHPFWVVIINSF